MKLIYLTSVLVVPNELGQEKIKEATEDDEESVNYDLLGIKPPKGKPTINEDGNIHLLEDEIDYIGVNAIINLNQFSTVIDGDKFGSVIYTKDGGQIWVFETADEVSDYVEFLSLSSFEKWWINLKISFKSFLRRIKNKITGKKEINIQEILDREENRQ